MLNQNYYFSLLINRLFYFSSQRKIIKTFGNGKFKPKIFSIIQKLNVS